jgi:hypothetical protein
MLSKMFGNGSWAKAGALAKTLAAATTIARLCLAISRLLSAQGRHKRGAFAPLRSENPG